MVPVCLSQVWGTLHSSGEILLVETQRVGGTWAMSTQTQGQEPSRLQIASRGLSLSLSPNPGRREWKGNTAFDFCVASAFSLIRVLVVVHLDHFCREGLAHQASVTSSWWGWAPGGRRNREGP